MTLRRPPPAALFAAVLALAAVVRVGVVVATEGAWVVTDSGHYFRLAGDILAGTPTAERSNGYPLLIAALARALPHAWLPVALVSLNVAASVATVALVGGIGRRVAGWRVGLLAALGVALFPNQLHYVRYLLTEAPTTLLATAAVWLLLRWGDRVRGAVAAGVLLGLGVLLRSSLLAAFPLVLGALLTFRRGGQTAGGVVAGGLLVFALNAALLAAGTIAPPQHTGPNLLFAITSTHGEGVTLSLDGFAPEEIEHPLGTYLRFAAEHPATFARQRLSALWELWGPWPDAGGPANPRGVPARLLIGLRFLLIALAAGGLARHVRDGRAWLLAAPLLAITAVHTAFFAEPRFTVVVEPFAFVLAAWWLADGAAQRPRPTAGEAGTAGSTATGGP